MPVRRTLGCYDCGRSWDVTLTAQQVDDPLPSCPYCHNQTHQEFKAPAIRGEAARNRAATDRRREDIAVNDMGVADFNTSGMREGDVPKVRYKDSGPPSSWVTPNAEMIQGGAQFGRQIRRELGGFDGVDMIKGQPDLIEISKRRART
jgi:hypothetical protein